MVQIPDSLRPYANTLAKIHFWILAAAVPLILLPLLFATRSGMSGRITEKRKTIENKIQGISAIKSAKNNPHPNEKWRKKIQENVQGINDETLTVWTSLWNDQRKIRQWPSSLGPDFVKRASDLKPDGSLPRALLERYQNGIRQVVRQIPARMGVADLMTEAAAAAPGGAGRPVGPGTGGAKDDQPKPLVTWSAEDQRRLYASFDWEETPSTTQVVMAQEELWMYGVLCDAIKKINSAGSNPSNIPIPLISEVMVGYPAAEDDPGASNGTRILKIQPSAAAGGMPQFDMMGPDPNGSQGGLLRPPHPRFTGAESRAPGMPVGMGPGMQPGMPPGEPGMDGPQAAPDESLKAWVYVDLKGKPLTASELSQAPHSKMVRLMPFVLRLTIDQRSLDALMLELASAPIPIDTRQVRVNPNDSSGRNIGPAAPGFPPDAKGSDGDRLRRHDVQVELRGTLAIAMPPDRTLLGAGDSANAPGATD
ncbi:MAG: hypothetical protein ACKOYJ_09285 [Planctomycetia bacterium]